MDASSKLAVKICFSQPVKKHQKWLKLRQNTQNSSNLIRGKSAKFDLATVHQQNPMATRHRVFAWCKRFELLCSKSFVLRNGRTSCPLRKALVMLFRDEMSERICNARTVTERKENRTLREKGVRPSPILLRCTNQTHVQCLEILGIVACV